ncbi:MULTISPECIES: hypothetical protein [unclassified Sphingosinithalassobacter]|uniref:hypothetical protein n=1 Tax=unclassified Sphingosinithalassobacter TaxID=2676235 RepID=UPI00165EB0B2|nr:hypothetical protein [Sphingosinithalassobacter sp. CS137]
MSDWFSTAVEMQREILRAQQAQMKAAQKMVDTSAQAHRDATQQMLDAGKQMEAMQQAGRKAVEANLDAWKAWASFWGWK